MPYLFPEEEPTVMEQCSQCEVYFPEDDAFGTSEKPLCGICAADEAYDTHVCGTLCEKPGACPHGLPIPSVTD